MSALFKTGAYPALLCWPEYKCASACCPAYANACLQLADLDMISWAVLSGRSLCVFFAFLHRQKENAWHADPALLCPLGNISERLASQNRDAIQHGLPP